MTALSSELSRRLSKAQELLENKKQKKALKNLWFAEALARGNAEALRGVLDVTTAFSERAEPRRKSDLANLVRVLHDDLDSATRQAAAPPAETAQPTSLSPGLGCGRVEGLGCFTVLVTTIVGAIVGGIIGHLHEDPSGFVSGAATMVGVVIGTASGVCAGLLIVLSAWLVRRFRYRNSNRS